MDKPWKEAILQVLKEADEPMSASEIVDDIVAAKLRKSVGATPNQTVHSLISTSIKSEGSSSDFIRVAKGQYIVRVRNLSNSKIKPSRLTTPNEDENSTGGIQALGMYWLRDLVQWKPSPKLLGRQQIGALPVNICNQIGLYLLYDGREVIYVGRTTKRPIGLRLFEHTQDRLRARWNRFSWFGMYPIKEDGSLSLEIPNIDADSMIAALEAVAIEALEPRQNRRRGDDFSGIEYIQDVDPDKEREIKKALLDEVRKTI